MRDITINNDESQNENQKTTPVMRSLGSGESLDKAATFAILQIWQEWRDSNPRHPVLETGALAT